MKFRIEELRHELADDYVRAHIALLCGTYAHLVGPDYARNRFAEFDSRVAELHRDIDETADAEASGRPPFRKHWVALNAAGGIAGLVCAGQGLGEWELEYLGDVWQHPATEFSLDHLYTAPGVHGSGLGQQLLDAALPQGRPAYLWVFSDNPRAIRFYERNGFAADGFSASTGVEWGNVPMHRMVRT